MRILAFSCIGALGGALALNAANTALAPDAQAQDESAGSIIAAQIRKQGFACEKVESADRDAGVSRPDLPVWTLKCKNASYRVQLVPNMAAKVERID